MNKMAMLIGTGLALATALNMTATSHSRVDQEVSSRPIPSAVHSGSEYDPDAPGYRNGSCQPDARKLDGICGDIYLKTLDDSGSKHYSFAYERKIYAASCVNFKADTPEQARSKIRSLFFQENDSALSCSAANFQVSRGSILKYAIDIRSFSIISNAIIWKIDLNHLDQYDQRTLLDFIEVKIVQNEANSLKKNLVEYYIELRSRGARHCHELNGSNLCSIKKNDPGHLRFLKDMNVVMG